MVTSSTHLAALLALLLGTAQAKAHRYRTHHHHHGSRRLFKPAFEMASVEAFRPFHASPRSNGLFTSAGPLVDVFQEVMGDVKRGERAARNRLYLFAAVCFFRYACGRLPSPRMFNSFQNNARPRSRDALSDGLVTRYYSVLRRLHCAVRESLVYN